jgi:hypothetical protein
MGHNKQSGGFREAPQQKLEGYETIPAAGELRRLKDGQSAPHAEPSGDAQDPDHQKNGASGEGTSPEAAGKAVRPKEAFDPVTGQPLS